MGRSTVDLAWRPPAPRPANYRVEVRYILVDDDQARVDWRPYAQVEVNAGRDRVTAHVRGLPSGGLQMLRIVAVDGAGRLAAPSPMVTVMMGQPSTWWRPTLLKVLILLLAVCLGLVARRKWEERQMLAEIDESRRAQKRGRGSGLEGVKKGKTFRFPNRFRGGNDGGYRPGRRPCPPGLESSLERPLSAWHLPPVPARHA